MSDQIKDGGPAFPLLKRAIGYHADIQQADDGLSVRDYFAAKAMAALIASPATLYPGVPLSARAYEIADAMLAAREAKS